MKEEIFENLVCKFDRKVNTVCDCVFFDLPVALDKRTTWKENRDRLILLIAEMDELINVYEMEKEK